MVKFLVEMGQPTFSVVLPSKQDEKINGVSLNKLRNVWKKYQLQVLHSITLVSGLPWETANLSSKDMCDHGLAVTFAVYSSSLNGRKSF